MVLTEKDFLVLVILAVGAAAWWTVQKVRDDQASREPVRVKTAEVKLATIEDSIFLTGVVEPLVSTDVKSEVTGRIEETLVVMDKLCASEIS